MKKCRYQSLLEVMAAKPATTPQIVESPTISDVLLFPSLNLMCTDKLAHYKSTTNDQSAASDLDCLESSGRVGG